MKKRLGSTVSVGAAAVAILLVGTAARARDCISIQFIACCDIPSPTCCPCPGDPMDPRCASMWIGVTLDGKPDEEQTAGACPCKKWNHAVGSGGVLPHLLRDIDGTRILTNATLFWEATSTALTGDIKFINDDVTKFFNKKLMDQYLDQNTDTPTPTFVQIVDIPTDLSLKYDLVIYTLVTQPNFGGEYAVNGGLPKFVLAGGNGVYLGPDFHEAIGDDTDFGTNDWGNYVVFRGLSGTTVTITATNALGGKAPINGVQIVNALLP